MTKQEATIKYITENYLNHNRLRHDIVADKLQVRVAQNLGEEANRLLGERQEYWREMTKHDINSIVCHCAQEYDQNITSREVMTALQSDLIPDVHPLREYIRSLPAWKPESGDWINFVASQVRVKNNGEDKIQQPKQLDPTIYTARNNTASGEGDDFTSDRPGGLSERTACCQTTMLLDRPYGAERPTNLTGEAGLTESGAHGLTSNSSQNELLDGTECLLDNVTHSEASYSPQSGRPIGGTPSYSPKGASSGSNADALWRICFKKWFVAMVASWMQDEVVNHQVLVLIGRQGIYKTTWLEHLIPPHLRDYACKLANSNDLNKDERMRIAEFGLISLDEIDSMNNRELNQLKSIITASDVNERAAYAYTKERRIRLASFCASGNRRDFLTDITGNRRWLPFEVESIQNPFFTTLPYDLMYAQAWALAQDPMFSYWFELDEIEVLEQHNQHFRDESNEEQLLPILFDIPAEGRGEFMTTAQISERLVTYGNIKKPMALSRLGMVLGTAGYKATKRKIANTQTRGWIVYQRDTDEISSLRRILKD